MRNKIVFSLLALFSAKLGISQAPGCPNVVAPPDFTLPCTTPCTTLTAVPFHVGSTASYAVSSIPYAPVITPGSAGGTAVSAGTDDVWSPVINLPFNFCYFGSVYTTCAVGSNGAVMFGPAAGIGGSYNTWPIAATDVCPSAALWGFGATGHAFGSFHDMYPPVAGQIRWHLIGTAPCRMFVVDFYNCAHYSCTGMRSSFQMVFYETTNVIETHIGRRDACTGWNGGRCVVGVQNTGGTAGVGAPGRNASSGAWTVAAGSPEGWRFTPNGPATYVVNWYQGGTLLSTGSNTVSVCPTGTTTYTASVTYNRCDGTTVTVTDPVTITMSSLPAPVVTPVAETCAGYNNGACIINNAPGPGPFTVTITGPTTATVVEPNTAAGTATFTSLPDGVYTYTVTSAAGCTYNGTFTINPGPPCCTVSATGTNVLCNGGTTGTLTATPTGVPGFTYSWSTTPVQTTATATGVPAGTYTITVTDNTGCVATNTVTITQPTAITASQTHVDPACSGGTNGSITITASGGTGTLQYSLNGGPYQLSNTFTGLAAGTYTVNVKDANGCIQTLTVTLANPPALVATLGGTTAATCGVSNGTITITASGGTGALSYDLNPGPVQASNVFTGLAAGSYNVVVTDTKGCTVTVTPITVGASPGPTASIISTTNVTCFGGVNGAVLIGGSGGSAPLSYTIDLAGPTPPVGPQASNSFTGLVTGTYAVTVTDNNGCTGTTSFTISAPPALTYTTTFTNPTCNGVCDGTITVTASGGTPGYQYSSNNGLTFGAANPMTGLCAGTIFVVVKDANGCLANSTVPLVQPAAITAGYTLTNPLCPGVCNGQIQITGAAGGTPGYQYQLDPLGAAPPTPLQASNLFTGLCDGTYTVIVQDSQGCQLTSSQALVDPPGYTINVIDTTESHCGFNDGSLEVAASGGFAPYTYDNVTITSGPQPTGLFSGLVAGGYNIVVTDNNGCVENLFVGVNDVEMDGILDAVTPATCYHGCDGTVQTHAVNGAPPIQYELDLSGSFGISGNFTGLCEGSHIVTIVDNGFCVFTIPFNVTQPDSIIYSPVATNVACSGAPTGTITFTAVTGGNGSYQYSIDNGATYQASPNFTGLAAGTYDLMVMDGNGCLGWNQVIITEATPITYTAAITDLTCNGDNTGIILIAAGGGTPGYTYSNNGGSTFQASLAFPGLAAGTYNIVIKDNAGCTVTGTETVNQPAVLTGGYTTTPTLCNGSCDGEILVTAAGGTPAYQYSSDNGVTFQTSNNLTGLCVGSYQVVVKDSHGCLTNSTQSITEPTAITYSTTLTPSTCGNPNGVIDFIAVAGGTPTYTYSIDNGVTFSASTNFPGLAAGTYDIIVEDNNGCQEPSSVTILNQASPVIGGAFVTDVDCFGACNGSLSSSATGGTGALTFDVGGAGQATGNFSSLCAGAYTLTVTDINGCTDTQPFTVTEPTLLSFTNGGVNLLCFNDNSGQVSITASGGVTSYLYSYDGGTTFTTLATATGLAAGTYNLVVKDAHGCIANGTQIITEPAQLTIASQPQTNITCFGACDGTATLNMTGGTVAGLYNYNWAGGVAGPTQNNATSLCAGTYLVDISDDNGCTVSTSFTLTEPPQVIITGFSATDVQCNGACDGTISIVAPAAVQFSVDGGATFQASPNFTGLCPGTYNVIAQDANGCSTTTSAVISEPSPLVQNPIADITICWSGYGELDASATGGTPPYTYTWNTGAIAQYYFVTATVPTTFTCTVTDQNGCVSNPQSANVSIIPPFQASVVSATDTICPGAQATFTASGTDGVPGYNYWWYDSNWDPIDSLSNDSTWTTPNVTTNGTTYYLLAFDQCPLNDTIALTVVFYPTPTPTFVPVPASGCSPLDVTFVNTTPPSMTNGTCTWDFGDGNTAAGCVTVTNTFYNNTTSSVFYDVTLTTTSPEGCTGDSTFVNAIEVYPDPVPDFTWTPQDPTILLPTVNFVNLTFNGNTYTWDFAGLDSSHAFNPTYVFNTVPAGDYNVCLEAVSPNGCIAQVCHPVTILDEVLIYVPNAFSPDEDGTNDILLPSITGILDNGYTFYVFDRWGEVIFQTDNQKTGWDGTYKSVKVKEDVYVWKIKAASKINGDVKEYVGHVTLLR